MQSKQLLFLDGLMVKSKIKNNMLSVESQKGTIAIDIIQCYTTSKNVL